MNRILYRERVTKRLLFLNGKAWCTIEVACFYFVLSKCFFIFIQSNIYVKKVKSPFGPIGPSACNLTRSCTMKGQRGWLGYRLVTPNIKSPLSIYTPWWRGNVKVKCLAREHNAATRVLKPGPSDPEFGALNTRPHFPFWKAKMENVESRNSSS